MNSQCDLPWLCAGDFNEVLEAHEHEQFGGQDRPERQMDGFRDAVHTCGLTDLGYIGLPYTWDNRQQGSHNVKVRLDRGLACAGFLNLFRTVRVWHVQTTESDHCSLVVECVKGSQRRRGRRRFRYEHMWRRHPAYTQAVETAWQQQGMSGSLDQLASDMVKALVWFWIIDETIVLSSMLSLCRLNVVGT